MIFFPKIFIFLRPRAMQILIKKKKKKIILSRLLKTSKERMQPFPRNVEYLYVNTRINKASRTKILYTNILYWFIYATEHKLRRPENFSNNFVYFSSKYHILIVHKKTEMYFKKIIFLYN
jgi:hypothetical protein